MNLNEKRIAFKIEVPRILELLSDQIYQSPLTLLRENTQNAFDAILMKKADKSSDPFEPVIEVTCNSKEIVVADNGIGMTAEEIESNFWQAGRSGKNTDAARAAGVVGTFGVGAMANFGVAEELSVESEFMTHEGTFERTLSSVRKSELSTENQTILVKSMESIGSTGTTVRAQLSAESKFSIQDAQKYLHAFVEFVNIPIFFNGEKISGTNLRAVLPSEQYAWSEDLKVNSLAGILSCDLKLFGMASGELRIVLENVKSATVPDKSGSVVLLQNRNTIRTLRSGFGLSVVPIQSVYQWGGVADLPFLVPTAGREALDASSHQLLQNVVSGLDNLISPSAAQHSESFSNDGFLRWIVNTKQFSLCGFLDTIPQPFSSSETLESLVKRSKLRYYRGHDNSMIQTYASDDEPLIVLSRRSPRRQCELGYLKIKGIQEVDLTPQVTNKIPIASQSIAQMALGARITRILADDYFLPVYIGFGSISSGLSLLVTDWNDPVAIYLDSESSSVQQLLMFCEKDYGAFSSLAKDFVRSTVFPKISTRVPSSTREGAEAFLLHLQSKREIFEYEFGDKRDIKDIFEELRTGRITVEQVMNRLNERDRSVISVSSATTQPLSSVVGEIESDTDNQAEVNSFEPRPGINRLEQETDARILTAEEPLNRYTCFLSLSDRVQSEKGEFFLQAHSTEIVWSGQRVIFVFQHHSRRFGLYYDILCPGLVGAASGGGLRTTSTISMKNRTFIPIPTQIKNNFIPKEDERKRFEVRCEILHLEESGIDDQASLHWGSKDSGS